MAVASVMLLLLQARCYPGFGRSAPEEDKGSSRYGSYYLRGRGGAEGEWFVVGLAVQKNYLSLYVNATEDGTSLGKPMRSGWARSRGAARTCSSRASDIDLGVLGEMVTRARELTR